MRIYGFRQVKIKVGTSGQDDPARLARFRKILGRRMDIRVDANEAWRAAELIDRVQPLLRFNPTALEQPVPHAEVDCLAELRPRLGIPVMLDESLCGYPDALAAVSGGLPISSTCGFRSAGESCRRSGSSRWLRRRGSGFSSAVIPGETSLLSAAGRHVAGRVSGLRYVEGSYDRHILRSNLTTRDITFGYGGRARPLEGPGLGVLVDEQALEAMTVETREICYG